MSEIARDNLDKELAEQQTPELLEKARREFFARPLTDDYATVWTELLARKKEQLHEEGEPVVVFRIAAHWLALPAGMVKIIIEPHTPHRIPHHAGILRGLVNVEGELTLCVSLKELFRFEDTSQPEPTEKKKIIARMIVINDGQYSWAFQVDEILSVLNVDKNKLSESPVTLAKSPTKLTRGIFEYDEKKVGLIDEELLLGALQRSLS